MFRMKDKRLFRWQLSGLEEMLDWLLVEQLAVRNNKIFEKRDENIECDIENAMSTLTSLKPFPGLTKDVGLLVGAGEVFVGCGVGARVGFEVGSAVGGCEVDEDVGFDVGFDETGVFNERQK